MKKLAIVVAFVLPFVFFGSVFVLQNVLNNRANPLYDYIYVTSENICLYDYSVQSSRISKINYSPDDYNFTNCSAATADIYRHNIKQNNNTKLTFEQAQQLKLSEFTSPDGFSFQNSYSNSLGFSTPSKPEYALTGKGATLVQNLEVKSNLKFIGWIVS
jgi:hypothetical protein